MIKITVINADRNSATIIDAQMPSFPIISGKTKTNTIWNNNVLNTEIIADNMPLFNAVKNAEPNIEKPVNK